MMCCAESDDHADPLAQQRFREGRSRKGCGLFRMSVPFNPNRRRPTMTMAIHPYDALMDITARPNVVFDRGEGSWLSTATCKLYPDFARGGAVNALGHAPAASADALAIQAKRLLTP